MLCISDFSCAKQFDKSSNPLGYVSDTAGTPSFWPPESIENPAYRYANDGYVDINQRDNIEQSELDSWQYSAYDADIWACAVTLYCFLYNILPFTDVRIPRTKEDDSNNNDSLKSYSDCNYTNCLQYAKSGRGSMHHCLADNNNYYSACDLDSEPKHTPAAFEGVVEDHKPFVNWDDDNHKRNTTSTSVNNNNNNNNSGTGNGNNNDGQTTEAATKTYKDDHRHHGDDDGNEALLGADIEFTTCRSSPGSPEPHFRHQQEFRQISDTMDVCACSTAVGNGDNNNSTDICAGNKNYDNNNNVSTADKRDDSNSFCVGIVDQSDMCSASVVPSTDSRSSSVVSVHIPKPAATTTGGDMTRNSDTKHENTMPNTEQQRTEGAKGSSSGKDDYAANDLNASATPPQQRPNGGYSAVLVKPSASGSTSVSSSNLRDDKDSTVSTYEAIFTATAIHEARSEDIAVTYSRSSSTNHQMLMVPSVHGSCIVPGITSKPSGVGVTVDEDENETNEHHDMMQLFRRICNYDPVYSPINTPEICERKGGNYNIDNRETITTAEAKSTAEYKESTPSTTKDSKDAAVISIINNSNHNNTHNNNSTNTTVSYQAIELLKTLFIKNPQHRTRTIASIKQHNWLNHGRAVYEAYKIDPSNNDDNNDSNNEKGENVYGGDGKKVNEHV